MNIMFAAVALAVLVVSPAWAQSYEPSIGSGNLTSNPYRSYQTSPNYGRARRLRALPPHIRAQQRRGAKRGRR
jgi:hypothetical protein